MTEGELADLWGRFLEGGSLSLDEETSLLDRLKGDSILRRQLADDLQLDGTLGVQRRPDESEAFARDFRERSAREPDGPRFADAFRKRLESDETRRRVRRAALAGGGALAVAAAILVLWIRVDRQSQMRPVGAVVEVANEALVADGQGHRLLRMGESVPIGELLETMRLPARLVIRFGDGTRVDLAGHARARLLPDVSGKDVLVESGRVTASVAPQPLSRPMHLRTKHLSVTVVGTELAVVTQVGGSRVEVTSGHVRISEMASLPGEAAQMDVVGGTYVEIVPGLAPAQGTLPIEPALEGFSLLDARTGRPVAGFDPIPSDAEIDLGRLPAWISLRANTRPFLVPSVRFLTNDAALGREVVETDYPFTAPGGPANAGDIPGMLLLPWSPSAGIVEVSASLCVDATIKMCPGPTRSIRLRFTGAR